MTRAAFGLWAGAVLVIYYRRAWSLPGAGALRDWTVAEARATLLPFGLLVLVAGAAVAWTFEGAARRRLLAIIGLAGIIAVGIGAATGPMSLPFAAEAARRAAAALAGSSLVVLAAWALGATAGALGATLWAPSTGGVTSRALPERLLFQLAAGFGLVAGLSGALALAGWYTPGAVRVVLGIALATGGARLLARRQGRWDRGWVPRGMDRVWFGITALALVTAFAGALAPETEYDALWYHLWLPRQWLLHGTAFDTVHEYVALYPLTWELVFGAGLTAGGPVAAKLLHFWCLPLLALTAWQMTRRFFPAVSPWLTAAVTVTVPTVLWEASTAYIDLALALYVGLALYALMAWRDDGVKTWFWLAALCLGLGAAVKHLGLVAVVLAAAALVLAPRDGSLGWATTRGWGRSRISHGRASWLRRLLPPALLVATALLVAAPWYVRAWQAAGNPVFPELFEIFGGAPALRWDAVTESGLDGFKSRFGVSRTPMELALLPWTVTMEGARFGGSLGPVFLALLPTLAWVVWREQSSRWLAGFAAGYLAVWASPLSSFQLRFLVPIVLPLSVLVSLGIARAVSSPPGSGRPRGAAAALGLALMFNLPPFMPLHEGNRDRDGWLTHVTREIPLRVVVGRQAGEDYLRERVPSYGAWQHLATAAPAAARVLVAGSRHNFYATREPLSMEAPAARPAWSEDAAQTTAALHALDVTYVLVEREWLRSLRPPLPALSSEAFRREQLTLIYSDERGLLYEAPRPSLTPGGR